jgi:hypothetical protein
MPKVEVSVGELLDKLTILSIKQERITDISKLKHIEKEISVLEKESENLLQNNEINSLFEDLKKVNSELWKIEDDIRILESEKNFGNEFIELARAVYITNDKRFSLKNEINNISGSEIREQKGYKEY